jgi:hypothetical protein
VSVEQPIRKFSKLLGTFVLESRRTQGARVRKSCFSPRGWMVERTVDHAFQVGARDFQSAVPCDMS